MRYAVCLRYMYNVNGYAFRWWSFANCGSEARSFAALRASWLSSEMGKPKGRGRGSHPFLRSHPMLLGFFLFFSAPIRDWVYVIFGSGKVTFLLLNILIKRPKNYRFTIKNWKLYTWKTKVSPCNIAYINNIKRFEQLYSNFQKVFWEIKVENTFKKKCTKCSKRFK